MDIIPPISRESVFLTGRQISRSLSRICFLLYSHYKKLRLTPSDKLCLGRPSQIKWQISHKVRSARDKCLNCWREKRCQHQRMSTPFMEVAERWSHSRTMFNFTNFTLTYSNIVLQQVLNYHDDHVKENTKSKAYTAPCKLCLFHKILNIPKHTLARKTLPLYPRQIWMFDMVSGLAGSEHFN